VTAAVTLLFPLVAALPQTVWEVVATALAVFFVGSGLRYVITGRPPGAERFNERTVRLVGAVAVLMGVGIGVSGFLVTRILR
jgi:hypothetical protein